MIAYRVHLAILGTTLVVLLAFLIALCTPISAGAAKRPCVIGTILIIGPGQRARCAADGLWYAISAKSYSTTVHGGR